MPSVTASAWESANTDWTSGDPGRVADVLSYAYATADAARAVAIQAGLDPGTLDLAGKPRDVWARIMAEAAASGLALELAAVVLHDPASAVFRVPLYDLLGDRRGEVEAASRAGGASRRRRRRAPTRSCSGSSSRRRSERPAAR